MKPDTDWHIFMMDCGMWQEFILVVKKIILIEYKNKIKEMKRLTLLGLVNMW